MIPLLCPAYLPNIYYFNWLLQQEVVYFSGETFYQKQTYRNRSLLYGANGILRLTIPIKHNHNGIKPKDKEVAIAYDMNWQLQHWKSLCSAYRSSPYFEFYEADLYPFFKEKTPFLFEYNLKLIVKLMELLEHPLSLNGLKHVQKRIIAQWKHYYWLKHPFHTHQSPTLRYSVINLVFFLI